MPSEDLCGYVAQRSRRSRTCTHKHIYRHRTPLYTYRTLERARAEREPDDNCAGRRTYLLPHARAFSRRGYDPDGSSGDGPISGVQM
ncbi:hypothetical protein EVAR_90662_1 [Eumeta japonica]|uniref:Uncharacterized protein n=1 Tax=Eumeta variegata TaxID=151549 RepID=A0A4C1ZEL2_EUMVA|nr:hypothetical protein EVAR_90662_1 [Eumeta japonica]